MKRIVLLIGLSISYLTSYSQVNCNGVAPSTVNLTDKVGICNGNLQRTATVSQLIAAGIDTTKVGRIEQGRGTAPIFMYFNGTSWVRNDTSYIPRSGASNITGNLKSNQSSFTVGLSTNNNFITFLNQVNTEIKSASSTSDVRIGAYSTSNGYADISVYNPSGGLYDRRFLVTGTGNNTPDQSFRVQNGLLYYYGDYRSYMTDDKTIPDIGKVKQLISDSVGTAQSTTLADGKIWIGDGTNTAFPRLPSGDWTISNLGVNTLATVNSNIGTFGSATKSTTATVNAKGLVTAISEQIVTPAIGSVTGLGTGVATYLGSPTITNFGTISGSQSANKVLASPDGTSGNLSARDLKRRDLKNTLTTIGTVASDDYSVDYLATRYTTVGSSIWTVSGGKLNAAGGSTKTLGNYVGYSYYGKINSKKETISTDIIVGTITSTSYGGGLSYQGAALAVQGGILLDNVNTGRLAFYFNNSTATEDISDGALSLSAGDNINIRLTILQNSLILVATNTTLSTKPSITYTKELINNNSTTYRTPNAGFATIFCMGGNQAFDNFSVVNNASKYPKVLFIDDSKGAGSYQSNEGQSYTSFLARKIYGQVEYLSGGGNYVADNNATEALAYEADLIFIASGTNDVIRGDAAATIMAAYATLEASLTGYTRGINLFYVNLPPNNTVSTATLNGSMSTAFGDNVCKIYATFVTNGATTIQAKYSNDGTHLTSDPKRIQSEILYDYGIRKGLWQTGENANMGGNEVHSNGNYTGLGGMNIIPQYGAHIYTYNNGYQFGISPTYNGIDGLALWSAGSGGNAVLAAGCNTTNGSTITNTHTAPMRLSLNNGDFKLSSDVGLSIGASLTPTNRLQYTNSSNTWEQINSYAIFGGNNATTNGNTVFRQTNGGADINALVMFGNGVTTGAGATSSGFGLGGGYQSYIGNGTRPIMIAGFSFGGTSTAGSETGYFNISTKPSGSAVLEAMRLDANQNVGIGTGSTIVQRLDVWSATAGNGIRNYNSVALGSTSGGIFLAQSPVATAANQRMATFAGGGYDLTNSYASARIQVFSGEVQTAGVAVGGYMTFETVTNGTISSSERMRINQDGNIGIGTLSPSARLHVEGTVIIKSYTVATLPACATGVYTRATVTDALAPVYDATVTGGGARVIEVLCNGTTWTCH